MFCTKYRYQILTGEVGQRTRSLIREICQVNYVDIVSGSMSPDHVHLLLAIPPNISLSKLNITKKIEGIAKLALEAKIDDFGTGSVSRKSTYPIGPRRFARNPNPVSKSSILSPNGVLQFAR